MVVEERIRTGRAGREALGLVVVAAAAAGVHAGLAPEHLHEWAPLGGSFAALAAALLAGSAALAVRPADVWPPRVLALLLGSTIAGYVLTRLFALPPLDPAREPLDAIGVCTTALEAGGLILALRLGRQAPGRRRLRLAVSPGGTR